MPAVDRAILRIGVWEILFNDEVPDGVAISEAVEAATVLSTDDSAGFINGLLAKIAQNAHRVSGRPRRAAAAVDPRRRRRVTVRRGVLAARAVRPTSPSRRMHRRPARTARWTSTTASSPAGVGAKTVDV